MVDSVRRGTLTIGGGSAWPGAFVRYQTLGVEDVRVGLRGDTFSNKEAGQGDGTARQDVLPSGELRRQTRTVYLYVAVGTLTVTLLVVLPLLIKLRQQPLQVTGKMAGEQSLIDFVPGDLTSGFDSPPVPAKADKIGSGILILTKEAGTTYALLLLRNSKHNDKTWGLPGGNLDKGESLAETAIREGKEEMGELPPATVLGHIVTRRGKDGKKVYTVFIALTSPAVKQSYKPNLDQDEHSDWRWFPVEDLIQNKVDQHPVVGILIHNPDNLAKIQALVDTKI